MAAHNQYLSTIHIDKLKGLSNVDVSFAGSRVTGLFGVNGCGKSTILHALACVYQPPEGSNNKGFTFPNFFPPTTLGTWSGSKFHIISSHKDGVSEYSNVKYKFEKQHDRWAMRNTKRPVREVFYIGVITCIPTIETDSQKSKIQVLKQRKEDDKKQSIIDAVNHILNESYTDYADYTNAKKKYLGVTTAALEYTAHSMGAGCQRLFKILNVIYHAPKYSLILIDELDITLHTDALGRLIHKLVEIAEENKLQIIFTSHREQLCDRTDINVRHIVQTSGQTFCFNSTTPACMTQLTGATPKLLNFATEDNVSKAIVERVLRQKKVRSMSEIDIFGSIENSFTLASAFVMLDKTDNRLIVADGDKYKTEEDKLKQIKKSLSGTEVDIDERRNRALSIICQFNLPDGFTPDKYLWKCLRESTRDNEIVQAAKSINARDDCHKYLKDIQDRTQASLQEVVTEASHSELWNDFVKPVSEWIEERKDVLGI